MTCSVRATCVVASGTPGGEGVDVLGGRGRQGSLWHEVRVGLMCVGADQERDGTGTGRHRYGGLTVQYETERAEFEQRVESGVRSQARIGEFGQDLDEPFVGGEAKSVAVDVMPSGAGRTGDPCRLFLR